MKIGGLLLALLVILLSSIPCCTFEECEDEVGEKHSQQEIPGDCEDACSPFLNCNGCAGFTVQFTPEENSEIFNNPSNKTTPQYRQRIPGGIIRPVWQPPQLS
jgi:hypothetical protein